ncbi:nitric oxide response protein [Metallosphaera javensis (ex Sakai et al. 2022)]|uniref:nitric oxide response protein n=1 Tax=Metallosphaera javensis (ex Sakai et al. 2022) TaxID=2775498 RepID=UPI00258ABFC8
MKPGFFLLMMGIGLLFLGGVPAVLNFMDNQGFPYPLPITFFQAHWFVMVYGFFLLLIGNELLVALSNEWRGNSAPTWLILVFGVLVLLSNVLNELNNPLSYYLVIVALVILMNYSRIYLSPSRIGLKPTAYNYLLFYTLLITSIIVSFQAVFDLPWLGLAFPALTIFAIMSRDLGLVLGGRRINQDEMVLAYISLAIGILGYGMPLSPVFMVMGWGLSLHASGIPWSRGRPYPRIALTTAWIWLLVSALVQENYDAYIHSLALGFLFNTVFGVDSVLIDMLVGITGKRLTVRPSYLPLILLNLGLVMRVTFDLGLVSPILLLSAPLQGIGIISFYALMFKQVIPQVRKVDKSESLIIKGERTARS